MFSFQYSVLSTPYSVLGTHYTPRRIRGAASVDFVLLPPALSADTGPSCIRCHPTAYIHIRLRTSAMLQTPSSMHHRSHPAPCCVQHSPCTLESLSACLGACLDTSVNKATESITHSMIMVPAGRPWPARVQLEPAQVPSPLVTTPHVRTDKCTIIRSCLLHLPVVRTSK